MSTISKQILEAINTKINKDVEVLERKKFSTLTVGKMYIIKKIVFMTTRFGKTIVVTLFDSTEDVTFQAFLPKHVVETLTEDFVKTMNSTSDKYTLTYLGQSSTVYSSGNTRALLSFGILE